ncbi:unnamed protein product [Sphenostylis stenocarpa]|uniref:Uncharacterized protein n=1 Tax=Sphenostylis stenocarpa TaxID=92480 RepID=A0AA86SBF0_9FABA|nr:unnamed protein product [Sphenostylis stenocarpa]
MWNAFYFLTGLRRYFAQIMKTCGTNEKMKPRKGKWQVVDINSINGLALQHVERDPTCYGNLSRSNTGGKQLARIIFVRKEKDITMGFLHKLWDETLAGPAPETGLGKLRKFNSVSGSSALRSTVAEDIPISRSITIVRTQAAFGTTTNSAPASPASSAPASPRTPLSRSVVMSALDRF